MRIRDRLLEVQVVQLNACQCQKQLEERRMHEPDEGAINSLYACQARCHGGLSVREIGAGGSISQIGNRIYPPEKRASATCHVVLNICRQVE